MSRYAESHGGHAHVHAATRSYSPSRFDRLMDEQNIQAQALAPYVARSEHYARSEQYDTRSRAAPTVVEEPVVEHEHHHIHHHIDHIGAPIHIPSVAPLHAPSHSHASPRSSFHEDVEDKYYTSSSISVNRSGRDRRRSVDYRTGGGSQHGGFARSELDVSVSQSRRGSVQVGGTSDWTIIDVPPGTTRITLDTSGNAYRHQEREDEYTEVRHESKNGIRRSRGTSSELWTEITKDLITADAIRDMGYQFEETDHFYYIFEYLTREQIEALIQLTSEVRRHRARQLEYDSISSSGRTHVHHADRYESRHPHREEERPEIVFTEETVRRARKKYYH